MFGKDAQYEQVSEDEDWGPGKRPRTEKESDAVNTLMTLHEIENTHPNNENKHPNNENNFRIRGNSSGIKRPCFRIPHDAVEVLIDSHSFYHISLLLLSSTIPTENKYIMYKVLYANSCPL